MNEFKKILESQLHYMEYIFESRKNLPDSILNEPIISNTEPAIKIFIHAIETLHTYSSWGFEDKKESMIYPNVTSFSSLCDKIILEYRSAIDTFSSRLNEMEKEEYDQKLDFITLIVMHTIHHIGQVMRLQKIAMEL